MKRADHLAYAFERHAEVWREHPVVPDLHEAEWQHVLQEPAHEFKDLERHVAPFRAADLLVFEAYAPAIIRDDTRSRDGHAHDIGAEE